MSDLISRQAAIDAIRASTSKYTGFMEMEMYTDDDAVEAIEALPSAQPEIIRCNSCKHWTQITGEMKGFGLGRCDFHDADLVTCNGFCYWAERRTDG